MEYTYFMFDGISSSKYNLYIINNGEDLSYPSQPGFDNQIVSPLYQGTSFLAGVNKKERVFDFNCWVDSLNRDSVRAMLEWLSVDRVGQLILDYNPNYYYNVKISAVSNFKHMAINEDGTSNYEFSISFVTIGDFAAISRQGFVIDTKANPLNTGGNNAAAFLNPDNLAPIGVWDSTANTVKVFNYGSEPIYPIISLDNSGNFSVRYNATTYYNYSNVANTTDFVIDGRNGFVKVGSNLAETVTNIAATTNLGPLAIPSSEPEVLYTTINSYNGSTLILDYTDQILANTNTSNLYIVLQDGDYGYELLTQEMTEDERALYVTQAINEQYNKINKDGTNSDIDILSFNTDTAYVVSTPGQIGWNQVDGTFDLHLLDSVKLQAGQEIHFYGKITGSFDEKDVMQFAGAQGDHLLFKKAVPSEIEENQQLIVGVATTGILDDNFAYITWFGKVNDVDTYAWPAGTILYFDPATGGLTDTEPTAPNRKMKLAAVVKQSTAPGAGNGKLFIRPTFGFKLKELDDVYVDSPDNGDILVWNSSTSRWENSDKLSTPRWTDLTFPFTSTKLGANDKPDFDYTNIGLLFPQNNTAEIIYLTVQFPHGYKEGTDINPHLHCIQKANQAVRFDMQYKWYNVGDAEPTSWTTHTMDQYAIPYTSGNLSQIVEGSAYINGAGMKISSIMKVKLFRNDNTYTGDFFADQFDIHYQVDAYGSEQEYIK